MDASAPGAWTFDAIGTAWQIDTIDPVPDDVRHAIASRIERFDRDYSRFRDDSLVAEVARSAGTYRVPADAEPLIDVYARLYRSTAGAVTPFVGDRLAALGYDARYSLVPQPGSDTPSPAPLPGEVVRRGIPAAGALVDVLAPVTVDIGAAGKGYLVDLVADILLDAGFEWFTVDASGDMVHRGAPIRVALEHPYDASKAIGVVELGDGALCASAINRRIWGRGLHHVLDGRTGHPTAQIVATWALAADARTADGVATALFFAEPAALGTEFAAEGLRMFTSGRAESTTTFPGEIFT